jgi:hypothetical protein
MKKVIAALVAAGALGLAAAPALGANTGTQPPGPPTASGSPNGGTNVGHCVSIDGGKSVVVVHADGTLTGGGNC